MYLGYYMALFIVYGPCFEPYDIDSILFIFKSKSPRPVC